MLNYIWAGLIIFSLVFALAADVRDLSADTYRNGATLPVEITFQSGYDASQRRVPVTVGLSETTFRDFYGVTHAVDTVFSGTLIQTSDGRQLRFAEDAALPEPLATIRSVTSRRDNDLRGPVVGFAPPAVGSRAVTAGVTFDRVRFVKLNSISAAALDFAETAVTLALGLIGALALWMGLLKIAEESGMLHSIVRFTQPVVLKLFPEIPRDHPALGMIVLNLSANMLGLGNAATPLGLKAMEELQSLNPTEDTATNSMVMLLALNTASVQLVPPVILVAIMGLQINQLMIAIIIVTFCSGVTAVIMAKLFGRFKRYRETDPANASKVLEG